MFGFYREEEIKIRTGIFKSQYLSRGIGYNNASVGRKFVAKRLTKMHKNVKLNILKGGRTMKKILISVLAAIIALSVAVITAECISTEKCGVNASFVEYAEEYFAINAKRGDTIEVVTTVKNAKLVSGLLVKMTYDTNMLSYDSYEKTKLGRTIVIADETNHVSWSIMFPAKGTDIDNETEVNVIRFKVLSDISSEEQCLSCRIEEFYDTSSVELSRSSIDLSCRVIKNTESVLLGDANGDGKVSNADALAIVRHSIKASMLNDDRVKLCDVNSDGKVTNADALQITRYCIGYKSKYPIGQPFV